MESSSKSQTIACDIVLLPSKDQAELAAQASQTLTPQGLFVLDNQNRHAHASLYMFQMNLENQDACLAALQQLAKQTRVQQLTQDNYLYQDSGFFGRGYMDIAFARNTEVDALQMRVVDTFNNLRADMRESDKQKMTDATGLLLENLQKYGYPSVGELFRPHITLTKFPAEITPDLSTLPDPATFTGKFDRLGLFEMGPNGTCVREIAAFPLIVEKD